MKGIFHVLFGILQEIVCLLIEHEKRYWEIINIGMNFDHKLLRIVWTKGEQQYNIPGQYY